MIELCGFGVSNYYNKLKLVLLEKDVPFKEVVIYPWQPEMIGKSSPIGKIPFIRTPYGDLSESQVALEFIEEEYPARPLYPSDKFQRAKCRELIQHLELNCEWVVRRLYKECFFGGQVSAETKEQVLERLHIGLKGVAALAKFGPYIFGEEFTAADCVAYLHFLYVEQASERVFGTNLLTQYFPEVAAYRALMEARPHLSRVMAERLVAMDTFQKLNVKYDG